MTTTCNVQFDDRFIPDSFKARKLFRVSEELVIEDFSKTLEEFYSCFQDGFKIPLIIRDLDTKLLELEYKKSFDGVFGYKRLPPKGEHLPYYESTLTRYEIDQAVFQTLAHKRQDAVSSSQVRASYTLDGHLTYVEYFDMNQHTQLLKILHETLKNRSRKG
jgi:hypothetical protein